MGDIQLEVRDGIAIATLSRPDRLNAFRGATYRELHGIAGRLGTESTWRALVITGAGRAFCAGQDLDDVPESDADPALMRPLVEQLQDITRCLANSPKPTVAAINGPAVGFGVECTLALDLRIASTAAYFMLPELARGLFHTNGTYHYLAQLVGRGLAADMILTGRRIDAHEALQRGLVTRIAPGADLLPQAIEVAARMASLDPAALAFARKGLRTLSHGGLEDALRFESLACMTLLTSGTAR